MKLNLVIDASGIFYRTLFTIGNYGVKKGQLLLESDDSKGVFIRKLATDFAALVKSIENVNRVIVCLDSNSWRKKIPIDGGGYKSNRAHDEEKPTIDWTSFYELTNEFGEILQSKGYIISKVKDAEADDLLFLWSRRLNDIGESVMLVTGDRDLHQCIQTHKNGSFTIVLDPVSNRRRIILTQETYDSRLVNDVENDTTGDDLFNLFNPESWAGTSNILDILLSHNDHQITDPDRVATRKVILGDGGDAVPGVITWIDKKDVTKTRGMTDSKLDKALATLSPVTWQNLQSGEMTEFFVDAVNAVYKSNGIVYKKDDIQKLIHRNITLVILNFDVIPKEIQNAFILISNEITSSPINMAREQILEGTHWWTDKKSFVPQGYGGSFVGAEDNVGVLGKPVTSGIKLGTSKGANSGSSALF